MLILSCMLLITALAAAYTFMKVPVYQASAGVAPPKLSDIAEYNLGRSEADLEEYEVADVYGVFKNNLLSGALKRQFFENTYLTSLSKDQSSIASDQIWKRFNDDFTVQMPDENNPGLLVVKVLGVKPELVAGWANMYVEMAAEKSVKDMQVNIQTEIGIKIQSLSRQIDSLRVTALKRRDDRIVRLKEALLIADAVGFDSPQVTQGKTSSDGDFAEFMDGNLMYMRGAKAVQAELAILEKRTNDDPYIPELRDIENQLEFLQKIDFSPDNVAVYSLDSKAQIPETPIKPNKALILVLGVIGGAILGVFIALVRFVLAGRQMQAA